MNGANSILAGLSEDDHDYTEAAFPREPASYEAGQFPQD